jgi:hypothetical protein
VSEERGWRLSPSPLAGEGGDEGDICLHPHLNPPPSRGGGSLVIFMVRGCPPVYVISWIS